MEFKTRIVEVVDYDPQWPQLFLQLRSVIKNQLGDLALAIEHVGSTSIIGLAAKPIIDLDVMVASNELLTKVICLLAELGYKHEGDLGISGREAFSRSASDVPRNATGKIWPQHHLYVCPQESVALKRHLAFRNYLRNNPDEALAYAKLKCELAQRFRYNVDLYCEAKTEFIENILEKALS
ncbi:hypothetical protein AMR41_24850 [Hapalosiphon sp. MRB220]|jgi:GrpB-like predicted nucleotidyltransferase (UPF0157 family)|nr:hypothetical protein AMR41_24850 [Hapalosiphon sp. MRB220]